VKLTVTDDGGATSTVTRSVTVTAPVPNQAPTAAFTSTVTGLAVAVDAAASEDQDGSVASWAWEFGDGAVGTGEQATHAYAAAGTYPVQLTVTDDDGATTSVTRSVTVAGQTSSDVIASDTFDRTTTGGLGTADVGGAWTSAAGPTRQSVTGGMAQLTVNAGQNTGAYLGSVAQVSADVRTTVTVTGTPTGTGTSVYVSGRRIAGVGEYRVRLRFASDGRVALALSRLTGTTEAFPGGEAYVPGLTYTPGTPLEVRVQVSGTGTTQVKATVWADGTTEPATATMTRTDTTAALQAPGAVGLSAYLPGSATAGTSVRFSEVVVHAAG
jgi:PKD repeat protein